MYNIKRKERTSVRIKEGKNKMSKLKCYNNVIVTAKFLNTKCNTVFEKSFTTYSAFEDYLITGGVVLLSVAYSN